jgi:hypothetical protein
MSPIRDSSRNAPKDHASGHGRVDFEPLVDADEIAVHRMKREGAVHLRSGVLYRTGAGSPMQNSGSPFLGDAPEAVLGWAICKISAEQSVDRSLRTARRRSSSRQARRFVATRHSRSARLSGIEVKNLHSENHELN